MRLSRTRGSRFRVYLKLCCGNLSKCAPRQAMLRTLDPMSNSLAEHKPRSHPSILRLQGLDALGNIAIVDVAAIDFHEVVEGITFVTGGLKGTSQFVMQSGAGVQIKVG